MTHSQFDALAELLRLRVGPARECARLVIVEGISTPDAAKKAGILYKDGWSAVERCRRGMALVSEAAGLA